MKRRSILFHTAVSVLSLAFFCLSASLTAAADDGKIPLPPPDVTGGKPLMQALQERRTTRELDSRALPEATLGNLLWATFGVNRPATGHRTAPSAMNSQEVEVYVARPDGFYVYEATGHQLRRAGTNDIRPRISGQAFAKEAPVVLVYVARLPKLEKARPETRAFYAGIDTGSLVQNAYLYCASAGLGTVVFDLDRKPLAEAMGLTDDQQIILAQAVGYPKGPAKN